ncbi:MAG: macro domain-containing protein [Chloroflexi bacterium]|nr:macro domain-containing protein [Chloroflexota bacterium]
MPNRILASRAYESGCAFHLVQGDLLAEEVDAIVNPANEWLAHGGGVAGLIVRVGGRAIQDQSDAWVRAHGPVSHDRPAWTSAGALPCRYVIHAVGPVWGSGDEDAKLAAAVTASLRVAEELGLASISLPAISTGIFGFPKERAAPVILLAIDGHLKQSRGSLGAVRLCLYDDEMAATFLKAWGEKP